GESSSVRGLSVDSRHGLRIVLALSGGAFEGEVTAVIGLRRGFAVFGARPGDLDVSTGSRLARDRSLGLDRLVLDLRCRRGFGLIAGFFEVEVDAGLLERVVEVGDPAELERSSMIPFGRAAARHHTACRVPLEDSATGVSGLGERITRRGFNAEAMHPTIADVHELEQEALVRDDLTVRETSRATGLLNGAFAVGSHR